jgi:integrase
MPRPNRGASLKWIEKRKAWYVVWYEAGRERSRSTGTSEFGAAEAYLLGHLQNRQDSLKPSGPRDPSAITVAEVLSLYGQGHAPTTASPARIAYAIDALLPFWGENTLFEITTGACKRYNLQRKRAPATVRRELTTLRAAINYAHHEGYITRTVPVELPDRPAGKDRWLTMHEAARLLNAARTARGDVRLYLPLFIIIALYTGARKEAILSLRWPQVNLDAGQIDFARPDGRKTSKGRARQPIPPQLMTFLKLARRRGTDLGYVVHDGGKPIKDIGGGWLGGDKKPNGSFGSACKRAGLIDVTPHTLRHTCGTWKAQEGVPLWQIGGWLGHSDSRTTELYAHHHPDHLAEALKASRRRK